MLIFFCVSACQSIGQHRSPNSLANSDNQELVNIFKADQGDRIDHKTIDWPRVNKRDAGRRIRVKALLDSHQVITSNDFFHAAMVFQHGRDTADFQLCHQLALHAVELDANNKTAKWLAAASKDRELMNLGKPQRYGTQFQKGDGDWELYPVDPAITDEERAMWNVPPLEEAKKRLIEMNAEKK